MKRGLWVATALLSIITSSHATLAARGSLSVPAIHTGFSNNFNPFTNQELLAGTMFEPLLVLNTLTDNIHYRLVKAAQ